MAGTCVDCRRLWWVVLVGLTLIALMMPAGALASSHGARSGAPARHATAAATRQAAHHIRFGRKVG